MDTTPMVIGLVESAVANMDGDVNESLAIDDYNNISFHIRIDNTDSVGTIYIRESNDGSNWANITYDDDTTSISVTSGTDVNQVVNVESFAKYIEFFFDRTSGDGILEVDLFLKN